MRVLDRYILRELVVPFVLGIAIFTSILLITRILKMLEMVVNRGVPALEILKLFSYILPAFLELTVPMAFLLAILVAFGRLSSDCEITALRASGVSLYRLLAPVGAFAFLITVMTIGLSSYVRPWGNSLVRTGLYEIVKARASAGIKPRVFNAEFADLVIYVDRIDPPGNDLHGILISDTREADKNTVYAKSGAIFTDENSHTLTLRLFDGGMHTTAPDSVAFQNTEFKRFDITLDLDLTLADLRETPKNASEMTLAELRTAIAQQEAAGQSSFVERLETQRKLSIPFACMVFAALGVPLGIHPSRSVHSRGFSVSLVLILFYYLLLTLGENLGERGTLPVPIAAWLPNILLSAVAAFLLARSARETGAGPPPGVARLQHWVRSKMLGEHPASG